MFHRSQSLQLTSSESCMSLQHRRYAPNVALWRPVQWGPYNIFEFYRVRSYSFCWFIQDLNEGNNHSIEEESINIHMKITLIGIITYQRKPWSAGKKSSCAYASRGEDNVWYKHTMWPHLSPSRLLHPCAFRSWRRDIERSGFTIELRTLASRMGPMGTTLRAPPCHRSVQGSNINLYPITTSAFISL